MLALEFILFFFLLLLLMASFFLGNAIGLVNIANLLLLLEEEDAGNRFCCNCLIYYDVAIVVELMLAVF